ncbi:MAG: energy-coupling factor transporter transmembrane protein EcfT [Candidatus Wukongarchaeota archaeon]|nr:energy-coupling factor transporter transmembrane component T [Candidatus Wukongarchaeota archaeon]MDO8128902.1 energy-coupling factor transporter transmembrane component T [Candidatus Wukongarchaeota archaeon]
MKGHYFTMPFKLEVGNTDEIKNNFSPQGKLVSMLCLLIFIIAVEKLDILFSLFFLGVFIGLIFGGEVSHAFKHSLVALPFLLPIALLNLLTRGGEIIYEINLYFLTLHIYEEGLKYGILFLSRGMSAVIFVLLVFSSMTLQDFIDGLKAIRMPKVLTSTIMITLRYIPLIISETNKVRDSQKLRGLSFARYRDKFKAAVSLIGMIFVRSARRSQRVYESMVLRGFTNDIPTTRVKTKKVDFILIFLIIISSFLIVFWENFSFILSFFEGHL